MLPRIRRKLFAVLLATVAFGLAYGLMYILWARFEPGYFYAALAGYAVLLLLALLLVGRKPKSLEDEVEQDLERTELTPGQASGGGGMRAPVAVLDGPDGLPLQVEKATGMVATPTSTAQPVGYTMRGFTLYERAGRKGPQRFFAQGKPVGGGQPIPLPEGFRAVWDAKKKRPFLEEIPEPALAPEAAEEFVVSRPTAKMPSGVSSRAPAAPHPEALSEPRARPCGAFTSPGIMCSRAAREGSPYCATHAKYRPDAGSQEFEVHHDAAHQTRKPFRGAMGDFEVRVAKPNAKPLRFKAPTVEVQTARPSTHPAPAPKGSRAKPAKAFKPAKPLRSLADRPFEVRVAKPTAERLRVTGPGVLAARLDKPKAPKPLRVATPAPTEVRTARPNAKPIRLRAARDPIVRASPSLAASKPLRLRLDDQFDVSTAKGSLVAPNNKRVRCKATLRNGTRCGNDARGGAEYCVQHKSFRPRVEAQVVHDTRARSALGVGDLDRAPAKSRSR